MRRATSQRASYRGPSLQQAAWPASGSAASDDLRPVDQQHASSKGEVSCLSSRSSKVRSDGRTKDWVSATSGSNRSSTAAGKSEAVMMRSVILLLAGAIAGCSADLAQIKEVAESVFDIAAHPASGLLHVKAAVGRPEGFKRCSSSDFSMAQACIDARPEMFYNDSACGKSGQLGRVLCPGPMRQLSR